MFIRQITKKNKGYKKKFVYHALMESYRTEQGPRQRMLLSLGKLTLPREKWKPLANRIEEILHHQSSLFVHDEEIEALAQHFAAVLVGKELEEKAVTADVGESPHYEEVDVHSVATRQVRSAGAEHMSLAMMRRLGFEGIFSRLGFTPVQSKIAQLLIVGRMVHPGSEWHTYHWVRDLSAIGEFLGLDFAKVSHNQLYRTSDLLTHNKDEIEAALRTNEQHLFSLTEKIILYDLTNTYFETVVGKSKKKRYGNSKEKRTDCPLVTLGIVLDEVGFPKRSEVFTGNVREWKTLEGMLRALDDDYDEGMVKTVIIDAGIATEDNLTALRGSGYDFICVARNKPLKEVPQEGYVTLRHTRDNKVEARMVRQDRETLLYCRSLKRGRKEAAMRSRFQERFETDLQAAREGLHKKRGTKRYSKVLERIGRLKQKHSRIAHYYDIDLEIQGDTVVDIRWKLKPDTDMDDRFSGTYCLRSSRTDLSEKEIWSLYILLTDVEDSFRAMKSELGLRPNNHQLDRRIDGHLFITVLAYHVVNSIQWFLHKHDLYLRWHTIRTFLSSQVRVITEMKNKEDRRILVHNTSEPEQFHRKIATALNTTARPLKRKVAKI
jgi:transposase